jgi:hypothetical protein
MRWGVTGGSRRSLATASKEKRVAARTAKAVSNREVTVTAKPGKKAKATGGKGLEASPDAQRVVGFKRTARASTTDSLSTKDLQELVTRMNLEQQYARLAPVPLSKKMQKAGLSFAGEVVKQYGPTLAVKGAQFALKNVDDPVVKKAMRLGEDFASNMPQGGKKKGKKGG